MEQAIGQVILKETLKARNQTTPAIEILSIVNSNILIWISVKLRQYHNFQSFNISYNKYFYYLCSIIR